VSTPITGQTLHDAAEEYLAAHGRLAGTYSEQEYVAALEALTPKPEDGPPGIQALRDTRGAREAVARRVDVVLAGEGKTIANLDAEGYLARYREAEREVYPDLDE
jgi:hypothetical protein